MPKSASANRASVQRHGADQAGRETWSLDGKMSASAAILLQRLGDDAHVGDAGCLTASMTVAKAPKGTFSSARTKIAWPSGSRIFWRAACAPIWLMFTGSLFEENALLRGRW